ncbi:MAG: bifunctional phosphoglucose/phosphomannose isomerase [bacterium]
MQRLNVGEIAKYDTDAMLDRILNFPAQLREAHRITQETDLRFDSTSIANVCLAGMGGSAISGDVVKGLVHTHLRVPMVVNRHYTLPAFVARDSLVILSSYSGNTEETLEAYDQACAKKAQIVCVTSGGKLRSKAEANRHPVVSIPTGFPPRAALGYLCIPILFVLQCAQLIVYPESDLFETIELLQKLREAYHPAIANNKAKAISLKLQGRIPLIYASVAGFEAVALRWKAQLDENSKVMAFCNVFPELNHNEIMGYGPLQEISQQFQVISLKDRNDHPQVQKRMAITREIIEKGSNPVIEVESEGNSLLARMFSLIYLGDMVSFYLAILNQVNPTSIDNIDYLKRRLSAS